MSSQISANSIDALKDLRVALALFGDDALGALETVGAEVRRTLYWLHQERPFYWQEQIKRRRERVATAQAELFRKQLSKTSSMSEQVENVKRAQAELEDAERRLILTRKWQAQLQQAVLEYQGTIRRIKTLASSDVPSAVNLLTRLIDALESYISVTPPSSSAVQSSVKSASPEFEAIATKMIAEEPPAAPIVEPSDENEIDGDLLGTEDEDESSRR